MQRPAFRVGIVAQQCGLGNVDRAAIGAVGQHQIGRTGRRLVDIAHGQREGLRQAAALGVGGGDLELERWLGLVVEAHAGLQPERPSAVTSKRASLTVSMWLSP